MPRLSPQAGLMLTAVALAGVIAWEVTATVPEASDVPHMSERGTVPTPTALALPDRPIEAWKQQVLARPLFNPSRRPIASAGRESSGLPRLSAIILTGPQKLAIFAGGAGGRSIALGEGGHIGGYEVTDIGSAGATVVGPEGQTVVSLAFDPAAPSRERPAPASRTEKLRPAPK